MFLGGCVVRFMMFSTILVEETEGRAVTEILAPAPLGTPETLGIPVRQGPAHLD